MSFGSNDPAVKAAVDALNARWPWTLSRRQLLDAVRTRLSTVGLDQHDDLTGRIDSLLEVLIVQGHARIRLAAVTPAAVGSPIRLAPAIRRMARLTRDDEDAFVFNTWHKTVPLAPVDRHLIPLLDGRHDRKALLDEALEIFRQNVIRIERDGLAVADENAARMVLAEEVDSLPQRLAALKQLDVDDYTPSARSLRTAG
jgi:methyltransferase-like protein